MRKRKKIYIFAIIVILLYLYAGDRTFSLYSTLPLKLHNEFMENDLIKQYEDNKYIASIYVNEENNILFTVVRKNIFGYKILVISEMSLSQKVFDYRIIYPDSNELKVVYYGYINDERITRLDFCNQSSVPLYPYDNATKIFFGLDNKLFERKNYTLYDNKNKILLRLKNGELLNELHS